MYCLAGKVFVTCHERLSHTLHTFKMRVRWVDRVKLIFLGSWWQDRHKILAQENPLDKEVNGNFITQVLRHYKVPGVNVCIPYCFIFRGLDYRWAAWYPTHMSNLDNDEKELCKTQHQRSLNMLDAIIWAILKWGGGLDQQTHQVSRNITPVFAFCRFNIPQAHPVVTWTAAQLSPVYKENSKQFQIHWLLFVIFYLL